MGFGVSLILIAVGAILSFAIDVSTKGVDVNTIGVILMAVGAVGFVLSLIFWSSWGGWRPARRDVVVRDDDRPVYPDRY